MKMLDPIDLERGTSMGSSHMERRSSVVRHETNAFIRLSRICRSQGVFTCSLLFSLFILMSLIAAVYLKTGGGPSKSGFGCDLNMAPPHSSNRTVGRNMCEAHLPATQPNKDVLEKLITAPVTSSVRFLVIGDWGRDGWCCQRDVSVEMARAASALNPRFIANTGDSFYEYGLMNENEEQVKSSWTEVYHVHDSLKAIPWYTVLGNHEYRGSITAILNVPKFYPQFVIQDRFYDHVFVSEDSSVRLHMFFLDTSPMIAAYKIPGYDEGTNTMLKQPDGIKTQWSRVEEQLQWLDGKLNASDAEVKIVVGHHPAYTSGAHYHEDDLFLRQKLSPILEQHKVMVYFSGHDHNLQEYWRVSSPTHYIVSAAGSKVEGAFTTGDTYLRYFDQINGFCAVEVTKNGVNVVFVDYVGTVIRTVEIRKQ